MLETSCNFKYKETLKLLINNTIVLIQFDFI